MMVLRPSVVVAGSVGSAVVGSSPDPVVGGSVVATNGKARATSGLRVNGRMNSVPTPMDRFRRLSCDREPAGQIKRCAAGGGPTAAASNAAPGSASASRSNTFRVNSSAFNALLTGIQKPWR